MHRLKYTIAIVTFAYRSRRLAHVLAQLRQARVRGQSRRAGLRQAPATLSGKPEGISAQRSRQLPEGGDFEALHCQPSRNFDRSTKLGLTTEPPLLGRCCWAQYLFAFLYFVVSD